MVMNILKCFSQNFDGIRPTNPGLDAPFIRINTPDKMKDP
jgi:hypothetical protein